VKLYRFARAWVEYWMRDRAWKRRLAAADRCVELGGKVLIFRDERYCEGSRWVNGSRVMAAGTVHLLPLRADEAGVRRPRWETA
jgi:hypothetical protein